MLKSFGRIKKYYKLTKLNPRLVVLEFITFLLPSLFSVVSPILSAGVISSLTVFDFSKAALLLFLDFLIILLTSIFYFVYHLISNKTTKIIVRNLQEFVYTSVKENANLTHIHSSTLSNVWLCAEFNKNFLFKVCFFIKALLILGIIVYFKFIIGIIIFAISFLTFLLLKVSNKKIQEKDATLTAYKQNSLELFNNIQQGTKVSYNPLLERSMKEKYFKYVDGSIEVNNKISFLYFVNNNFISLILKCSVFALTLYLIFLVKTTTFTLTLYLILTPYLTSSTENLIAFFELFPEIGIIDNALQEFEALKFQAKQPAPQKIEVSGFSLYFSKLCIESKNLSLSDLNVFIPFGFAVQFVGKPSARLELLNVLMRKSKPKLGAVFLDDKNICDFDEEQFSSLFEFISKKPYFYKMSIQENLFLVCKNRNKILRILKSFNFTENFAAFSVDLNTIVDEKFNETLLFFLGLVRAYLANAKFIVLCGLPEEMEAKQKSWLSQILKKLKTSSSVLVFGGEDLDFDYDKIIEIKNNQK